MSGALVIEGGEPAVAPGSHATWPQYGDAEARAIAAVMASEAVDVGGPHSRYAREFEAEFASYCGARHCRSLASGTDALVAALRAAGIGPGTRVIVPALGFPATPQAVALTGAAIDFCDVDPETFNVDVAKAKKLIRPTTQAIVVVHSHGLIADMGPLGKLAKRHRLVIIEDAAQAAGATQFGRMAGTIGLVGAFSLNVQKPLQCGDGGLLVTDDEAVYRAAVALTNLGTEPSARPGPGETAAHWSRGLGGVSRLYPMAAAIGRMQLRRLPGYLDVAEANGRILIDGLAEVPGFAPPHIPPGNRSTFHMIRVMLDPAAWGWDGTRRELRDRVMFVLATEGVAVRAWGTEPLPRLPAFRQGAVKVWRPGLDLTLAPWDATPFVNTCMVLDSSFVLFRVPFPIHVQSEGLMDRYVAALAKVFSRREVVLRCDYEPLGVVPAIPEWEL